ncbi:hypothetical protein CKN73_07360 [Carnobacterium divergens]|uniref:phage tail spike protein n=1 Tax=Carnobacterium divergens TaxID=2748 RepID=UPI00107203CD|nr:phage tail spike protein [Carnobacterium divergens]TFJ40132.1 hypothetical protein CKN77_07460 [Carnobacterium divergens]TFJ48753.1 hypothetical protein CKN73_07360 [Carnobacterium divergens]TFJ54017.1 hypothetical protein CKN83_07265 [Carnobacterium divergens]TFJ59543.1 hypothetical protein CKN89_07705 [Carnobacterium divergens]TFJ70187.1 hypothetical protein CKN91_07320 [Carnobacterium divergens]
MYQVLIKNGPKGDELEIHSPFSNDLKIDKGSIKKGINTFDSFNLSFLPNNPAFGKIKPLTTLIRVFDSQLNKNIFKGRVLIPTDQMESNGGFNCSYTCASDLSYLQDTIQKYAKIQDTTPEQFFKYLIEVHNSQIEEHKRFIVGVVNVTNNTDNVYRYVDDLSTTWDTIQDKLISRLGGEIRVREVNGVNYIDYVTEIGEHTDTTIELSKNLISLSKSVDPTEIVTRLYPRGERLESEEETGSDASQPRLTISSVNGGRDYLDAPQELINEFGIIEKSKEWSEVTQPQILKSKGQQFLDEQKSAQTQYSLTAVDLSLINMDIRRFEVANYYLLKNPVMGIDEELRIVGIGIDIIDVETSELTIGDRFVTLSQYQIEQNKKNSALNDVADKTKSLVKKTSNLSRDLTASNKLIEEQQKQIEDALKRIKELEDANKPPDPTEQKGSDISEYNASIDWAKFKSTGHTFVMIKGGYGKESSQVNPRFSAQVNGAISTNIKIGMYWFSYATTIQEAIQEANLCCDLADKYRTNISYPISFDWENDSMKYANSLGVYPDKQLISDMALAFCNRVIERGYKAMNYSNLDYYNNYFDDRVKKYDWWLARPGVAKPDVQCSIWQSELDVDGTSRGINGNADFDISFKNY